MKRHLYCKKEIVDEFERINTMQLKKDTLSFEVVENGIVFPCKIIESANYRVSGGVTDADFNPVELSFTKHSNFGDIRNLCSLNQAPPPLPESIDFIDEEVVWLGYAWDFYGHFLSDSLGRLWYLLSNKNLKVCYISKTEDTFLDFFRLFGLKDEQMIRVTKPTRFRKVIVPEPAFRYHDYYHEKFKDVINEITKYIKPARFKKVYLSRGKFNPSVPTVGEKVIENAFKKMGFKVIYPERLSLKKKIAIMKGAEFVAGTTGTNMHNILFANDGVKSVCLNRSADVLYMQLLIDEMKNLDAVYVDVYHNPLPISYFAQPYMLGITEELLQFFKDYNFKFKYKFKKGKYKFNREVYDDFSKDMCRWLCAWTEVNSSRPELLPETLKTSDILDMLGDIWKIYNIDKIAKRKKLLKKN